MSSHREELAAMISELEADMSPEHLTENRARLERIARACEVLGPAAGVAIVRGALAAMEDGYRFTEALDLILEALEHT